MADIVQLVENGEKKYLKTHVKAVDGLNGELAPLIEALKMLTAESTASYDSANTTGIKAGSIVSKRIGNQVFFTFSFQTKNPWYKNTRFIATLPYTLLTTVRIVLAGTSGKMIYIDPANSGLTAADDFPADTWLTGSISFPVAP